MRSESPGFRCMGGSRMFPFRKIKLDLHEIEYFGETRNGQFTQMISPRTIISMGRFVEVVVRG